MTKFSKIAIVAALTAASFASFADTTSTSADTGSTNNAISAANVAAAAIAGNGALSTNTSVATNGASNGISAAALTTTGQGSLIGNGSGNTTTTNVTGSGVATANNVYQQSSEQTQTIRSNQPVMLAPLTTSGMDTCLGSATGGFSIPGFGVGGGSTYTDNNCVMLKNSKRLQELGLNDAALMLLVLSNDKIKESLMTTNPEIYNALTTKAGSVAKAAPKAEAHAAEAKPF